MLEFIKRHSYDVVKMFINQLAISIFGFSLAFATGESLPALFIGTSAFSILFYLFLIYVMMWDLGAKDCRRLERNLPGYTRLAGLYMALLASIPNLILALLITLGTLIPSLSGMAAVGNFLVLILEGMYDGILTSTVNGNKIGAFWPIYFALPIPLLLTSTLAYFAGSKEFKLFGKRSK
jgi:hypothetical protein